MIPKLKEEMDKMRRQKSEIIKEYAHMEHSLQVLLSLSLSIHLSLPTSLPPSLSLPLSRAHKGGKAR